MSKRGLSILPIQNGSTRQPVCQTGACRREEVATDAVAQQVMDANPPVAIVSSSTPSREIIIINNNNTIQYPSIPAYPSNNNQYHHNNYYDRTQYCYPSACFLNPYRFSYCSPAYYPQSLCRYSC